MGTAAPQTNSMPQHHLTDHNITEMASIAAEEMTLVAWLADSSTRSANTSRFLLVTVSMPS